MVGWNLSPADLSQLVSELSPAERSAVEEFITFLKEPRSADLILRSAAFVEIAPIYQGANHC